MNPSVYRCRRKKNQPCVRVKKSAPAARGATRGDWHKDSVHGGHTPVIHKANWLGANLGKKTSGVSVAMLKRKKQPRTEQQQQSSTGPPRKRAGPFDEGYDQVAANESGEKPVEPHLTVEGKKTD